MNHTNKYKRVYVVFAMILIAMVVIYFSKRTNTVYGNDKESIQKVIHTIEGYKDDSIEILELKDFNDTRIVGFLSNNNPACIQFSKNQKGNYEWTTIEKHEGQSFTAILIRLSDVEFPESKFMIVTNQENNIARMELQVNKQVIDQKFTVNQKAVTWIDLPEEDILTFKYKYFDKEGNLLNDK